MFGGLDIKGTPDRKKIDNKDDGHAATAVPPSSGLGNSSAFSFLNPAAPASKTESEAPASAFSFLNTIAQEEPSPELVAPPAASASAFSFLATSSMDHGTTDDSAGAGPEVSTTTPDTAFSFLQQPSVVSEVPPLASETATGRLELPSFSFLGSSGTMGAGGGNDTVSTMSRDSPALSETGLSMSTPMTTSSHQQQQSMGIGVTFESAASALASKKPKKRRARTAKVGVASTSCSSDMIPPRPPMSATATTTTNSIPEPTGMVDKEAAVEATRRAEEFMIQKLKEESASQFNNNDDDAVQESSSGFHPPSLSNFKPVRSIQKMKDTDIDDDDVIAQARAAAEEAQQMAKHKSSSFTDRMGLGGLFRASRSSPPGSHPFESNHSSTSSTGRPPAPMTTGTSTKSAPSAVAPVHPVETAADRLRREQEETHRVIAQRQLEVTPRGREDTSTAAQKSFAPPLSYEPAVKPAFVIPVPSPKRAPPVQLIQVPQRQEPLPKTPMDRFQDMLTDFRQHVVDSMQEVMRLRQHRTGLLEERFVTIAKERLASQQKAQAEGQQMAAAEAEDFEMADRMQSLIDAHERDRIELVAVLENISRALSQLEAQKQKVVEEVTKCFEDVQTKLKAFQKEQETEDNEDATGSMRRFETVSKQLSTEHERLQHDLKHLERDEALLADERKELEASISDQAGQFETMRDETKTRLVEVEDEIAELRKQLEAKLKIAAELRTDIAGHEESILKVRVKFSRQLSRLKKKETTLKDNREEWAIDKKAYDENKEEHESRMAEHSEVMLARERLLEELNKEVEMAETFKEIVSKEIGFNVEGSREDSEIDKVDGELAEMQANVVKCDAAVSEAKEFLKVATSALNDLEEEVNILEARIPVLEELKKEAAAKRDFKVAGKASKEIKEALARMKECQDELIKEALERKEAAEKDVKKLEVELDEKRKIAGEQERASSITAMQRLADNIRRLVATKEKVCSGAKEKSIQGVGAFVIDIQVKALQLEGRAYGEKYGGWEELVADIGLDHTEESTMENNAERSGGELPEQAEESPMENNSERSAGELPEQAEETEPVTDIPQDESELGDALSLDAKMTQFRDLSKRFQILEEAIEKAVDSEEFDIATELNEELEELNVRIENLHLTAAEMEQALLLDDSEQGEPTEDETAVSAEQEAKKDGNERPPAHQIDDEHSLEENDCSATDNNEPCLSNQDEQASHEETEPTEVDKEEEAAAAAGKIDEADEEESPEEDIPIENGTKEGTEKKAIINEEKDPGDNTEAVAIKDEDL